MFNVEVPDEVLLKGWLPVLAYVRELRAQGGAPVREARVFLLGEGGQGKTSLMRALLDSGRDRADPIDVDDRTVGIDVEVRRVHWSVCARILKEDEGRRDCK